MRPSDSTGAERMNCPRDRRLRSAHMRKRSAARALAFAASSSRSFGGALVWSESRRRLEALAMASTAARNGASFALDGLVKPLIFLTNWNEALRTSSGVTGGWKLKRGLIFLHIRDLRINAEPSAVKDACSQPGASAPAALHGI